VSTLDVCVCMYVCVCLCGFQLTLSLHLAFTRTRSHTQAAAHIHAGDILQHRRGRAAAAPTAAAACCQGRHDRRLCAPAVPSRRRCVGVRTDVCVSLSHTHTHTLTHSLSLPLSLSLSFSLSPLFLSILTQPDMEKVLEEGEMTEGQWAFAHDLNELVNTILLEARYFIIVRLGVCVCVCV
jgi:hypothetical protein